MFTHLQFNVFNVNIQSMQRGSYHHGNLRSAILNTSLRLVQRQGPDALVAREVAREVGVTPAAIYRHFEDIDHLRAQVAQLAREQLAKFMIEKSEAVKRSRDPKVSAVRRFQATGRGYVEFAIAEPGLFAAAFVDSGVLPDRADDPSAWDVLQSSLDELAATGMLQPQYRDVAPVIAWTSVHGLASILVFGSLPPNEDEHQLIDAVIAGVARAIGIE